MCKKLIVCMERLCENLKAEIKAMYGESVWCVQAFPLFEGGKERIESFHASFEEIVPRLSNVAKDHANFPLRSPSHHNPKEWIYFPRLISVDSMTSAELIAFIRSLSGYVWAILALPKSSDHCVHYRSLHLTQPNIKEKTIIYSDPSNPVWHEYVTAIKTSDICAEYF